MILLLSCINLHCKRLILQARLLAVQPDHSGAAYSPAPLRRKDSLPASKRRPVNSRLRPRNVTPGRTIVQTLVEFGFFPGVEPMAAYLIRSTVAFVTGATLFVSSPL